MPGWNLRFMNGNVSGNRYLILTLARAFMVCFIVLFAFLTMSGLVVSHASQKEQIQARTFLRRADKAIRPKLNTQWEVQQRGHRLLGRHLWIRKLW